MLEDVWFDIIVFVERPKTFVTEQFSSPDTQIAKLPDPKVEGKEEWEERWQNPEFRNSFPNLVFRLVSLENRDKYTQEQRQIIFELGFTSFTKLFDKFEGFTYGQRVKVNKQTQLWENESGLRTIDPDIQDLRLVQVGCFILLGLSIKNREDKINQIIQSCAPKKQKYFRIQIMNSLITIKSPFRQWVFANNLDEDLGFEWDSEVAKLGLILLPQDRVPREFKNIESYPPLVVFEFLNHISRLLSQKPTEDGRSRILKSLPEFELRIKKEDFNNYPGLGYDLQKILNDLESSSQELKSLSQ